ncbi:hypothetical protein SAMN02745129_2547 [Ferrimonas marina]|uniref:Uncharacterized protein n=1 Tax=Ferrimonas marina TaxID=299255 RepID=A0A1M5UFE1_9GAMM|nr:hypothetical protein SAMN02745129_2547 [Ferrimonas marina]
MPGFLVQFSFHSHGIESCGVSVMASACSASLSPLDVSASIGARSDALHIPEFLDSLTDKGLLLYG